MSPFLTRRFALAALAGALAVSTLPVMAESPAFNTTYGLAIRGFDPVAYFTENKALKGLPNITVQYDGAIYEFATEQNKAQFLASPAKYIPQYGGFCAWATSQGYKADVDPHAFAINDGKLYLNFSAHFRDEFQKDAAGNVRKADVNWPTKVRNLTEVAR